MVTEMLLFSVLLLMYKMHNGYMHKHKKSTLYNMTIHMQGTGIKTKNRTKTLHPSYSLLVFIALRPKNTRTINLKIKGSIEVHALIVSPCA